MVTLFIAKQQSTPDQTVVYSAKEAAGSIPVGEPIFLIKISRMRRSIKIKMARLFQIRLSSIITFAVIKMSG